jgi:hypothetical protein
VTFRQGCLLATIFLLTALGLNTSNQGINNLTGESHNPVIAVSYDRSTMNLYWLGSDYALDLDRLPLSVKNYLQRMQKVIHAL